MENARERSANMRICWRLLLCNSGLGGVLCLAHSTTVKPVFEKMVYYAQCCCCFTSKTGAKIISILGLIFSSLTLIANIIGLAINPQAWVLKIGIRLAVSVNSLTAEVIYLGYALVTIGQIGYLAMFAMLFHGIKTERHGFMMPFLVFDMISLVVSVFQKKKIMRPKFKFFSRLRFTDFNHMDWNWNRL